MDRVVEVKGDTLYVDKIKYETVFWSKWCVPLILIAFILYGSIWFVNSTKFEELQQLKSEDKKLEEQKQYDKSYQSWEVRYNSQNEKAFRKQNSLDNCMEDIYKEECDSEKESLQNVKNKLTTIEVEKPIE